MRVSARQPTSGKTISAAGVEVEAGAKAALASSSLSPWQLLVLICAPATNFERQQQQQPAFVIIAKSG